MFNIANVLDTYLLLRLGLGWLENEIFLADMDELYGRYIHEWEP